MNALAEPTQEQRWWADEEVARRNARKTSPRPRSVVAGWDYDPRHPYGVRLLLAPSGSVFVFFPDELRA